MPKIKTSLSSKIIFSLIIAAITAVLVVFFLNINQRAEKKAAITIDQERKNWQNKLTALEEKITHQDTIDPDSSPLSPPKQTQNDETVYTQAATQAVVVDSCKETAEQLDHFFKHLDNQDYFKEFELDGDAKQLFGEIINKMLMHHPKIIRETDSLLTILQNTAHFYRILGGEKVFILKKIMAHEKALLEPAMAEFFTLMNTDKKCLHIAYPIKLPLKDMYSYSVFFLNTLGGQSYLFRRDLTLRTLTKYYCVLVLDQANHHEINHLGIDIRPPLNTLISEMGSLSGLRDKEKYIDTLFQLQEKYEKEYGN
jgi:hypothetical protein